MGGWVGCGGWRVEGGGWRVCGCMGVPHPTRGFHILPDIVQINPPAACNRDTGSRRQQIVYVRSCTCVARAGGDE